VGFMRDGRMIAEGRPDEILSASGMPSLEDAFLSFASKADRS
jgi:hypothetical protein